MPSQQKTPDNSIIQGLTRSALHSRYPLRIARTSHREAANRVNRRSNRP
ncbi:MAG: hypothetical protein AB2598_17885 [Candidatus Thiodiazotropha sp.]